MQQPKECIGCKAEVCKECEHIKERLQWIDWVHEHCEPPRRHFGGMLL